MKMLVSVLFILACFTSSAFGEDKYQADRELLRATLAKITNALNSQNMDELAGYLSKDFRFTTLDQKLIKTPEELKKYYESLFKSNNAIIKSYKTTPTFEEGGATFLSDTICYCVGSAIDEYTITNVNDIKLPIRWSTVLEKEDGVWKVKVLHLGANFYDNPVIDKVSSGLKLTLYIAVAFAFILGILSQMMLAKKLKK